MNGDGYDDVIVGAPGFDAIFDEGRAYIFYGSEGGIILEPHPTIIGTGQEAFLGTSVTSLGDVNGDGFDDITVGAPGSAPGGRVYIFHGSAGGIGDCDLATPDACDPHITLTGAKDDGVGFVR